MGTTFSGAILTDNLPREDAEVSPTSWPSFTRAAAVLVPKQSGVRLPGPTERRILVLTPHGAVMELFVGRDALRQCGLPKQRLQD